jgi:ribonuclease III
MQKRTEYEPQSASWFKDGDFKNHILNEKNIPLTKKFLNNIFKKYGLDHTVKNIDEFQLAMTHVSYCYKNRSTITDKTANMLKNTPPISTELRDKAMSLTDDNNYEPLEFRGDGIAHGIITEYICDRYFDKKEGFWTKLRAKIEKSETFSLLGKALGLDKYVIIARNMELENARETNAHLTEDVFEAFLGALSKEISYEKLSKFIINIIEKELDLPELIALNDNYKDLLMQYCHVIKWPDPIYEDVTPQKDQQQQNTNNNNNRIFIVSVIGKDGVVIGTAKQNTKPKAQQLAAKAALEFFGQCNNEKDDDDDNLYGELSESDEEGSIYECSSDDS